MTNQTKHDYVPGHRVVNSKSRWLTTVSLYVLSGLAIAGCSFTEDSALGPREKFNQTLLQAATNSEQQQNHSTALSYYLSLYERDPNNLSAVLGASRNFRQLGRGREAQGLLRRPLRENPGHAGLRLEWAKVALTVGTPAQAVDVLDQLARERREDWEVQSLLGIAHDRLGEFNTAAAAYKQALELNPGDMTLLNNFALSHVQADQPEKALPLLEEAASLPGATAQVRQNLAMVYAMLGDTDAAKALILRDLPVAEAEANLKYFREIAKQSRQRRGALKQPVNPINDTIAAEQPTPAAAKVEPAPETEILTAKPLAPIAIEELDAISQPYHIGRVTEPAIPEPVPVPELQVAEVEVAAIEPKAVQTPAALAPIAEAEYDETITAAAFAVPKQVKQPISLLPKSASVQTQSIEMAETFVWPEAKSEKAELPFGLSTALNYINQYFTSPPRSTEEIQQQVASESPASDTVADTTGKVLPAVAALSIDTSLSDLKHGPKVSDMLVGFDHYGAQSNTPATTQSLQVADATPADTDAELAAQYDALSPAAGTTETITPAPVQSALDKGFRVQLGSFQTSKKARLWAQQLADRHHDVLANLDLNVVGNFSKNRAPRHRVVSDLIVEATHAEQVCEQLRAKQTDCIIVEIAF